MDKKQKQGGVNDRNMGKIVTEGQTNVLVGVALALIMSKWRKDGMKGYI